MSTHTADMPIVLEAQLWERLERLAADTGRSVSDLASAVLREFVDENESQLAAIDVGIAQADRGELVDYEEVKRGIEERLAALSVKR
jgi:predicted transcriptional regulator